MTILKIIPLAHSCPNEKYFADFHGCRYNISNSTKELCIPQPLSLTSTGGITMQLLCPHCGALNLLDPNATHKQELVCPACDKAETLKGSVYDAPQKSEQKEDRFRMSKKEGNTLLHYRSGSLAAGGGALIIGMIFFINFVRFIPFIKTMLEQPSARNIFFGIVGLFASGLILITFFVVLWAASSRETLQFNHNEMINTKMFFPFWRKKRIAFHDRKHLFLLMTLDLEISDPYNSNRYHYFLCESMGKDKYRELLFIAGWRYWVLGLEQWLKNKD